MSRYNASPDELRRWFCRVIPSPVQWGGPGGWSGRCLSPLRPEKNPSFGVCCDPERAGFLDRTTGQHGGVLELARLLGVDPPGEGGQADPEALAKAEAERQKAALEAARAAVAMRKAWDEGKVLDSPHVYQVRKGLPVLPGLKVDGTGGLLVPLYDSIGGLAGVQRIGADGSKRLIRGSVLTGSFHSMAPDWRNPKHKAIYVAEGYATAYSLQQLVGDAGVVLAAFSTSNVHHICGLARKARPNAVIYAASDRGAEAIAEDMARKFGCVPCVPPGDLKTDWNDIMLSLGLEAAREELQAAKGRGETMAAEILRLQQTAEDSAVDQGDDWGDLEVGPPIPLRPLSDDPGDDDFPGDLPPAAAVVARVVSGFPEAEPPRRRTGLRLVRRSELKATPPQWLVRGLLEQDVLLCVFGEPGCGKSFLSVDLACSVATGVPFHGRKVRRGPVVLVVGEGLSGLKRRIEAWEAHHGVCAEDLFISTSAASLTDQEGIKAAADAVASVRQEVGVPALILVDTLNRNFGPADENSTQDMTRFVGAMDWLRMENPGSTVGVVHHSGKGDKQQSRGSSVLHGATDTEMRVTKAGPRVSVEIPRLKDGEAPPPMGFDLQDVDLPGLVDEEGRPVHSAVLVEAQGGIQAPRRESLRPVLRQALDSWYAAAKASGRLDVSGAFVGVHVEDWRREYYRVSTADSTDLKKKNFQNHRRDLVELKWLEVSNDLYRLGPASPGRDIEETGLTRDLRERIGWTPKGRGEEDLPGGSLGLDGPAEDTSTQHITKRETAGKSGKIPGLSRERAGTPPKGGSLSRAFPVSRGEGGPSFTHDPGANRPDPSSPTARAATAAPPKAPTAGTPPTLDRAPAPPPKAPAPWGRPRTVEPIPDDEADLLRWLKGGVAR